MSPIVQKVHHVAYRCKDALETARWYEKHLNMKLILSIAEDAVPSTGAADPYMHIFLDAGMGNVLAFLNCLPVLPWDVMRTRQHGHSIWHWKSTQWKLCLQQRKNCKQTVWM